MDQIKQIWAGAWDIPGANWIIGIAGLVISVLVAFYFVKLFRDMALGRGPEEPTDILNEFRRLRDEGTLEAEEFERLAEATRDSIKPPKNEPPTNTTTPPIVPR